MAKHNKKRNVGLLHEQLVRHASEMTVQGKTDKANQAISIMVEFFQKNTELLREFRLFTALVHTNVDNRDVARRIIEESRRACENHDPVSLDREKSRLIKEINHGIDRQDFYNQRVKNYKILATVQALLNEWRGKGHLRPDEVVKYESVLEDHLTRNTIEETVKKNENANPLVFKLMTKKFNKKYNDKLTLQQRDLLETRLSGNIEDVILKSKKIKESAEELVEKFFNNNDNQYLKKKRDFLKERIQGYLPDGSDESLSKALTLSGLINELEDKNV
tara:strand:- start:817 stop:1644 length:828 start_codon:yes stop_codon:yes gene_type:complete